MQQGKTNCNIFVDNNSYYKITFILCNKVMINALNKLKNKNNIKFFNLFLINNVLNQFKVLI